MLRHLKPSNTKFGLTTPKSLKFSIVKYIFSTYLAHKCHAYQTRPNRTKPKNKVKHKRGHLRVFK